MSSKVCQLTGRRPKVGMSYSMRGIAKKKKGIGLKVAGKSKRRFLPNVHKKRVWVQSIGRFVMLNISSAGMRSLEKKGDRFLIDAINKPKINKRRRV